MIKLYNTIGILLLVFLTGAATTASFAQSRPPVVHPPQPPRHVLDVDQAATVDFTLPEGTPLAVRFVKTLSSKTHSTGAIFEAILDQDLKAEDRVVIPRGSRVYGEVIESLPGGRVKGRAELSVVLREIEIDGTREGIETNTITVVAAGDKADDTKKVGVAAGIGALIGAIAGGKKGAAVGATIGGGAQTARVLTSRGNSARIERERLITFALETPFDYHSR